MHPEFNLWATLIFIALVLGAIMGACAYLVLLERKVAAWTQDRIGPNRAGPFGIFQPIADGLKFIFKEEIIPKRVDKLLYLLAPAIAITAALLAFSVVPFGRTTAPPRAPWPRDLAEQAARDDRHSEAIIASTVGLLGSPDGQGPLLAGSTLLPGRSIPTYREQLDEYNDTIQFVITPHADVGVLFVFAVGSLAVYAVVLAGWSSNNKYSFLGGLRSSAQLISYEIPMGMSVLGVFLVTGSLNLERIIDYQHSHGWNVLFQPLAALLFVVSVMAEGSRLPFDLPETEQELVGGYHTEYGAMKLGLLLLSEYAHLITTGFLVVILFFGGWELPWVSPPGFEGVGGIVVKLIVMAVKVALYITLVMVLRWTLPRFRYDQLMGLAWKVLIPLALVNVVVVLLIYQFEPFGDASRWALLPLSLLILVGAGVVSLRMPRAPTRVETPYRGHGTGKPDLPESPPPARVPAMK
jgi:NADH-quinone oxidoreductase subunit H